MTTSTFTATANDSRPARTGTVVLAISHEAACGDIVMRALEATGRSSLWCEWPRRS